MKKAWVYKRKNVKGWWVGWYENGKKRGKALPTKALAEHFRNIKYTQLNSDVFTSVVDYDWNQITEEYRQCKQVEGLVVRVRPHARPSPKIARLRDFWFG